MLEIVLLWILGKKIAANAKAKGHAAAGYVILLVALWFLGEICGSVVGFVVSSMTNPRAQEPGLLSIYLWAFPGAAFGALISFGIVSALPDRLRARQREPWSYEEEDEQEDYPRRVRRRPSADQGD